MLYGIIEKSTINEKTSLLTVKPNCGIYWLKGPSVSKKEVDDFVKGKSFLVVSINYPFAHNENELSKKFFQDAVSAALAKGNIMVSFEVIFEFNT